MSSTPPHDALEVEAPHDTTTAPATTVSSSTSTNSAADADEKQPAGDLDLTKTSSEHAYPPLSKVLVIMASLMMVLFLVALDKLIIGVAVPKITDQFNSLGDVGWYGSAYLLTSCAFILLMGKIYTFTNPKWVYLGSLVVFEIGSAVSGAAPNSTALIFGRAIAGLGSAGLFQGAIIIVVYVVPLHKRPQYMGVMASVFGVASVAGPLLGGAFTDGPGWRWCFYINLPCGALVLVLLAFFLHIPAGMLQRKPTTWKENLAHLDPIGTLFFLPAVICLLLALQWGGVNYAWSSARIIVLIVVAGVLFLAFVAVQRWKGNHATVPGRIFFRRSILAGMWFQFFSGGAIQSLAFFLPIWFQAIKHASAVHSGIMLLPFVVGLVVTGILAGSLTRIVGYYTPWMIVSAVLCPIAAGLITTFNPSIGHSAWIGYQALLGMGAGFGMQQANVAAQTVLPRKDVAIGASLMNFAQTLGGTLFISVGNNIFDSRLDHNLAQIPGVDVGSVASTGATELSTSVPANLLAPVLAAYNDAVRGPFYMATALMSCLIFGALAMEWHSVKKGEQHGSPAKGDEEKQTPETS